MLKAPFPWFGGKSRCASLVWERFGDVPNYVEPFAGSLAVLLGRPTEAKNETVNDKDAYLANFWRALQADPCELARWADWPVNEADLHARHKWLVNRTGFKERMLADPDYFDAKIAGWWVWGISMWIGSGWCQRTEWRGRGNASRHPRGLSAQLPDISGDGGAAGRGIFSKQAQKRPQIQKGGSGTNRSVQQVRPHLQRDGQGVTQEAVRPLIGYFEFLAARLRRVRVCCGEWDRILGPSPTTKIGLTGVFLDPPYSVEDRDDCYNEESRDVSHQVREWAIEHAADPLLRIALCGYEGEHTMPDSWECIAWRANGGYANQKKEQTQGKKNAGRERIWFSPNCLRPGLFGFNEAGEMLVR